MRQEFYKVWNKQHTLAMTREGGGGPKLQMHHGFPLLAWARTEKVEWQQQKTFARILVSLPHIAHFWAQRPVRSQALLSAFTSSVFITSYRTRANPNLRHA